MNNKDLSDYYSENYTEARRKFVESARRVGELAISYRHGDVKGPEGEELFIDVAWIGKRNAKKILIVNSGTHGVEGYVGSAIQTHWMRTNAHPVVPENVAIVFLHALNPWGFAHSLRCNEENVDLNRNFIDFSGLIPENNGYIKIHDIIGTKDWNEDALRDVFRDLDHYREKVGEQAFSDGFNGGQYTHPDGIFYGGLRLQWSTGIFRHFVAEYLQHVESAALIDLHTGIGPSDGHVFLCFHSNDSPAYARARSWWGENAVNRAGVTHKALARYQGLLVDSFVSMLSSTATTASVVEFGTYPRERMQRAAIAASWLQRNPSASADLKAKLVAEIREAYYRRDPVWRASVLAQGGPIIDRAIEGIARDVAYK